jgi:putative phage-type endonuclease
MTHDEWLKARTKCVTGTDVAAVLGLSRYRTPFEAWHSKVNPAMQPQADTAPMAWGRRLEPMIAAAYQQEVGAEALVKAEFTTRSIDGVPCGGTPDYLRPDRRIVLEIKTTRSARDWGEQGTDDIPPEYLCQVLWYCGLLEWDTAHVAVLIGASDFRTYNVAFDGGIFGQFLDAARQFWASVESNTPPAVDSSDAARAWLSARYRGGQKLLEAPDDETVASIALLRDVKAQINALEETEALTTNKLLEKFGDFDVCKIGGIGRLTVVRGQKQDRTDWKAVAQELGASPEIVAKHTTEILKSTYIKSTWEAKDE